VLFYVFICSKIYFTYTTNIRAFKLIQYTNHYIFILNSCSCNLITLILFIIQINLLLTIYLTLKLFLALSRFFNNFYIWRLSNNNWNFFSFLLIIFICLYLLTSLVVFKKMGWKWWFQFTFMKLLDVIKVYIRTPIKLLITIPTII
jgi:hypothetical protein